MTEVTEVPFETPCPACRGSRKIKWRHSNCNNSSMGETINEDAIIRCNGCGTEGVILDWRFKCENHDFKYCSKQGVGDALSCILNLNVPNSFKAKLALWIAEQLK